MGTGLVDASKDEATTTGKTLSHHSMGAFAASADGAGVGEPDVAGA